jgi:SAM-dependent methyltransferase
LRTQIGLARCGDCSFEFVNPRPGRQALDAFYGSKEYLCHRPTQSSEAGKTAEFLVGQFTKYHPEGGHRLLDFGCGGGWLLRYAIEHGWNATGYDAGGEAIATARRQGLPVVDDVAALAAGEFDVIIVNKVFEHVEDHGGTLTTLRTLLAPGGVLLIDVPNVGSLRARLSNPFFVAHLNFDERHRAFPIHLSYFTPRTLTLLLERNGYRMRACQTYGFGMEELIARPESADEPYVRLGDESRARSDDAGVVRAAKQLAKRAIKRVFFGAGLGENLLVVAVPA